MTNDYTLIIKNVEERDVGIYFCMVFDVDTRKRYRSQTNVTVYVKVHAANVETKINEVLQVGKEGRLDCRYTEPVYGVYWTKGSCPGKPGSEAIVHLDTFFSVPQRIGAGYDSGRFNITDDYTLIIKKVEERDVGIYFCMVSDVETGKSSWNHTNVTVIGTDSDDQSSACLNQNQHRNGRHHQPCTYTASGNQINFQAGCFANDFLLDVLIDISVDFGQREVGTRKETRDDTVFNCSARGVAVNGITQISIVLYEASGAAVQTEIKGDPCNSKVKRIVIPVVLMLVVTLVAFVITIMKARHYWKLSTELIQSKASEEMDANTQSGRDETISQPMHAMESAPGKASDEGDEFLRHKP